MPAQDAGHAGPPENLLSAATRALALTNPTLYAALQRFPACERFFLPFERIPWDVVLRGEASANCIYVRTGLLQKSVLATLLAGSPWLPRTWAVEDSEDVQRFLARSSRTTTTSGNKGKAASSSVVDENEQGFVVKSSRGNRGEGMRFFASAAAAAAYEYVPPLLLSLFPGRKFHIRALVLVLGDPVTGRWRVLLHAKSLTCLFAKRKFIPLAAGDETADTHLTNYSASREPGVPLDQAFLQLPTSRDDVREQVRRCLFDVFAAYEKRPLLFCPLPHLWELYGFDFAVSAEGHLKLLEANGGPSFSMYSNAVAEQIVRDVKERVLAKIGSELRAEDELDRPFLPPVSMSEFLESEGEGAISNAKKGPRASAAGGRSAHQAGKRRRSSAAAAGAFVQQSHQAAAEGEAASPAELDILDDAEVDTVDSSSGEHGWTRSPGPTTKFSGVQESGKMKGRLQGHAEVLSVHLPDRPKSA
eukprot:g15612.t1